MAIRSGLNVSPAQVMGMALALAITATTSSCTSTRLANVWKNPNYPKAPMTRLLVIAVDKDLRKRRAIEDGIGAELEKHGVKAIRAYQAVPSGLPDTTMLVDQLRTADSDGFIMIHELQSDPSKSYVYTDLATAPIDTVSWWTHYDAAFRPLDHVDLELHRRELVRNEIDVWAIQEGNRLIWTGVGSELQSRWVDPAIQEILIGVVPELARQGVIPKP